MAKINRIKETMVALQALGLNVETGVSPLIQMKDIEEYSGLRQVSNGSRIIRDDNHPFSCFKIDRITGEDGKSIQALQFQGFRDAKYQREVLVEGLTKAGQAIAAQEAKIASNRAQLEILAAREDDEVLFNKDSLGLFIV